MKIEYIYELDDYLVINQTQRFKRKFRKLRNLIVLLIAVFLLSVALYYSYKTLVLGAPLHVNAVLFFGLFILLIIIIFFLDKWIIRFAASRQNFLGNIVTIEFSPEFIELKMNHVSSKFDWLGIVGIDEVSSHFLLWINKCQAIVVPKRAYKNDEEIDNVRQYLSNIYAGEVVLVG